MRIDLTFQVEGILIFCLLNAAENIWEKKMAQKCFSFKKWIKSFIDIHKETKTAYNVNDYKPDDD